PRGHSISCLPPCSKIALSIGRHSITIHPRSVNPRSDKIALMHKRLIHKHWIAAILFLAMAGRLAPAHEIPSDVTGQLFFRPEGRQLPVRVRGSLKAMRGVEFPTLDSGNLDLSRMDAVLSDAVTTWISRSIAVYEDGARLAEPAIAETRIALESDKSFGSWES